MAVPVVRSVLGNFARRVKAKVQFYFHESKTTRYNKRFKMLKEVKKAKFLTGSRSKGEDVWSLFEDDDEWCSDLCIFHRFHSTVMILRPDNKDWHQ